MNRWIERKYIVNTTAPKFVWTSPSPLSAVPEISFAGGASEDMYALGATGDAGAHQSAITAINARDKRIITLAEDNEWPLSVSGATGDAWLVSPSDGSFSVRVVSISTDRLTVTLAEPLTRAINVNDAYLEVATWVVEMPVEIVSALARDVPWSVSYSPNPDLFGKKRELGLLHVVHQPFDTGVTSEGLSAHLRQKNSAPRTEQGWETQLQESEEELILFIRGELSAKGLYEDDIPAPQTLRLAHLAFAEALITEAEDMEKAALIRERGRGLAKDALKRIWVDSNQNGEPDEGSSEGTSKPRKYDGRQGVSLTYTKQFYIGMPG